jgi:RNA recognition motif-containing protein
MEPSKKLKLFTGEGLEKLPNGQPIPATLPPGQQKTEKVSSREGRSSKKVKQRGKEENWIDSSMKDWPENDFRAFIGNLASEVNEEDLRKAFSHFSSIQRIKIIRDKGNQRSKGFGFISFLAADEYLAAYQEMNGRHIKSQPIVFKKGVKK